MPPTISITTIGMDNINNNISNNMNDNIKNNMDNNKNRSKSQHTSVIDQMCGYTCFGSIVLITGHERLQPLLKWIQQLQKRERENNIFPSSSSYSYSCSSPPSCSSSVLSSFACLREPDVHLLRVCAKSTEEMIRYFQEALRPLEEE